MATPLFSGLNLKNAADAVGLFVSVSTLASPERRRRAAGYPVKSAFSYTPTITCETDAVQGPK